jgi:hypothetical protein
MSISTELSTLGLVVDRISGELIADKDRFFFGRVLQRIGLFR